MQKHFDTVLTNAGQPIVGVSVQVYLAGTLTPATLFSDNLRTPLGNPTASASDGGWSFYAVNGKYDVVLTKTGYTFVAADTAGLILYDPIDSVPVNVKDFGAVGDGVANDTAAFTAAGSSASTVEVYVGPGTYLLNSNPTPTGNVTWVIHAGALFTGAGVLNQKKMQFGSTHGVIALQNNKSVATVLGETPGLKIGICADTDLGWTNNPSAGDFVTLYPYITSTAVRTRIWALNPIVDIASGFPATAWCYEGNINQNNANAPDPHQTNHAVGLDLVSGGTFAPSCALSSLGTTLANRWKHGVWLESIGGQAGSTLLKAAGSGVTICTVDFGLDLSAATINVQGVRVGNTPAAQVAAIGVRQFANTQVGIFLQRFTDAAPTGNLLQVTNAANNVVLMSIDAVGGNITCPTIVLTAAAPTVGAGQISYGASHATTVGAAGGASALPATPLGYLIANVEGTQVKVPYYPN